MLLGHFGQLIKLLDCKNVMNVDYCLEDYILHSFPYFRILPQRIFKIGCGCFAAKGPKVSAKSGR